MAKTATVGTLKTITGNVLVVTLDDGSEHTYAVPADATVTRDGATALLNALRPGDRVTLTGDPVTGVKATS